MNKIKIVLALSFILFTSCQKNYDKFFEDEKLNMINTSKEIIEKLGLENFEILAYGHKSIYGKMLSKSVKDSRFMGDYLEPKHDSGETITEFMGDYLVPELLDGYDSGETIPDMQNLNNWVQRREFIANYEPDSKNEIMYEDISIIIIFDDITKIQKQELLKILSSSILNINRGDNVYIISKSEFNKFE